MPTTTLPLLLLFIFSSNAAYSSSTLSRRILHQPFFPVEPSSSSTSSPPAQPPSPTPVSKYPFSGSTPDDTPFFPSDHPPPSLPSPPPPPPSTSSFPANISSLVFPHSPSSHKSFSGKLILVTVGLSLSAAVISAVALLFFCRSHRRYAGEKEDTPANAPPTPPLPQLRKPSNNSSEFLYLGTLVNASAAINGGGARRGPSGSRKLQSPELHPLPPLSSSRQQQQQLEQEYQAQAESNNGGNERRNSDIDSTSSQTSSMTNSSGSPARSASISISPPMSNSPKNNRLNPNPKYSPDFVKLQVQYPVAASPPLPEMSFKEAEDEAEESPLLSNSSSSIRITSPVRLSPAERDWGVLGRASPPLSTTSTPTRKPSLKLPAFIGGRRQWTSTTNSPLSLPSPISSGASSPLSNSAGNTLRLSVSAGNTPRLSFSGCFSPRLSNLSDGKGSSAKVSPFTPPLPPPPPLPPVAKPVAVEKLAAESPIEGTLLRPRLKPLHWDKVRASSDIEMVWDQLRASSFKLNEDMIETLFTVNAPNLNQKDVSRKHFQPSQMQENRVLDPKKAQNIAILLRAVNVTMEEVCEALMDGNVDTLGTELLECLLRMAPTKEEERKLKEYKDDSPIKLGQAEKFLKAVIEIPFAFKRVEAMLYIVNFESEVEYLNKSFETLEAACDELRNSRMFMKLLEAVLKTGNRMNVGTNRGDAHAFKLDTLLKLVDIKGADGKTTLLHFVVQEIIRTEGQRFSSNDEAKCRKLGLQVVSKISSELTNVKKAAAMDFNSLISDVERLTLGLANIGEMVRLNEQIHLQEPKKRFSESMNKFMKMAEQEITGVKTLESVAISLVKEITEYFHGNSAKEEAHPFRIFMVVRDFLAIVDRVCKEVNITISEQNTTSSAHRYPAPLHPTLPIPVKPLPPQLWPGFADTRQSSFSEDDGSPYC